MSLHVIELSHPTDPRYLLAWTLPERITIEDLTARIYGKPLTTAPEGEPVLYVQPDGFGTDWVRRRPEDVPA